MQTLLEKLRHLPPMTDNEADAFFKRIEDWLDEVRDDGYHLDDAIADVFDNCDGRAHRS